MKPLIGITTGEIVNAVEPWEPHVYGQKHRYSDAIIAAGGIPVFIPFMPETELKDLFRRLNGVLFAGGNDISPLLYGEQPTPQTRDVSEDRDRVECLLMEWTLTDNKPLLAICRGYQLLNVLLGGSLYQDLITEFPGASNHELTLYEKDYTHIAHILKLEPDSRIAGIANSLALEANTRHHQGVKKIGDGLRATAWSEDGLVEALEHPGRSFTLGVQCHPESLAPFSEKWAAVFGAFVEATKQKT